MELTRDPFTGVGRRLASRPAMLPGFASRTSALEQELLRPDESERLEL